MIAHSSVAGNDQSLCGLIEIRHHDGPAGSAAAYERLHAAGTLRRPDKFWPWLLDLVDLRSGLRLLDVACGSGQLVRAAADRGVEAWGVDRSQVAFWPRALAARATGARSPAAPVAGSRSADHAATGSVHVLRADGQSLPFPDARFDRVTNIGSLEHFEDPLAGLREMARVLAPEGRALILLPNSFSLRGTVLHAWRRGEVIDDGQPIQRYGTLRQWERLLALGGLEPKRVVGCESLAPDLHRPNVWPALLRHPSRWLIPLGTLLPVTMAVEFVFLCRKQANVA